MSHGRSKFAITARTDIELLAKSPVERRKIAEAGLKPVASAKVAAPSYAEANLILECRKIYWQDIDPAHFLDPEIDRNYPQKDYHRVYFGEIVALLAAGPAPGGKE